MNSKSLESFRCHLKIFKKSLTPPHDFIQICVFPEYGIGMQTSNTDKNPEVKIFNENSKP